MKDFKNSSEKVSYNDGYQNQRDLNCLELGFQSDLVDCGIKSRTYS